MSSDGTEVTQVAGRPASDGAAGPPEAAVPVRPGTTEVEARAEASLRSPDGNGSDAGHYQPLVTQMLFAKPTGRYALAVTSALPGEGATTASVGVALALARRTGKGVLLVDANLRRPAVHRAFGLEPAAGLEQLILGNPVGSPTRTALPNLRVLTGGTTSSNPARLLTSERLRRVVGSLRQMFDFLVFDCPPVLEDVDATQLCRLADGVALVVRAGVTPRDEVDRSHEALRAANVVGVVLNRV